MMKKIVRSRNEDGTVFSVVFPSLDQELVEAATQQAPSKEMQYLRKHNFEQASVIAALREQMAAKDFSWEEEKMRILKALKSERLIRKDAQKGLKGQDNPDLQVQLLQTPSNQLKDSHQHNTELAAEIAALKQQMAAKESCWELQKNKILMTQRAIKIQAQNDLQNKEKEKQKVIDSLNQSLLDKQNEILMVKQTPSNQLKDSHQYNTELAAENAALREQMAAKESRWELEKNKLRMAQRAIPIQAQKQEVTVSLSQSLLEKQSEIVMVKQTPSNELKDSQQVTELAAENAALREQIAGWDLEKNNILNALRSERTIRKEAQRDLKEQDKQNPDLQVQLLQTTSNQLKDSQQHNTELAAENAALREQMAAKESRWELEKNSSAQSLIQVQMDLQTKEQEKQEVTDSLSQSLLEKQNEIVMVKQTTSNQLKDSHQHNTELAAENAALREQMAAKESGWELEKNSSAQSLIQAQMDLQTKEQEKQEVTDSLSQSLLEKQNEIVMVKQTTSNQLKDSHQHNTELAAENAALTEQMAAKESGWELEKNKILIQVQSDLQTKEQEKQEVTDSLNQSLLEKQNEILMVNQGWTEKCEKACEAWKEENREIRETCERELQSALDQKNLMVKSLQDESDRKVSQVVLEKDDLITGLTTAKMALEVLTLKKEMQLIQSEVRLKEKEMQLLQSEAEWSTKLAALEDQIRLKTDTTTDLQAQLLCLQELHQKLDLGALQMTAEEMNAKKKELKKLISSLSRSGSLCSSSGSRALHVTAACCKNKAARVRVGKGDKPITYEQALPPHYIAHRKGWLSHNTSNLKGEEGAADRTIEDVFIRRFMFGTFHACLANEIVIKRRGNLLIVCALMIQKLPPQKFYFLIGYSESLLSHLYKCPVKLEIQTLQDKAVYKYL
ncbi:uncharacterized protein LOC141776948 [Sebastes fasciatus]|uniref:uncharacterized protein LOC141776948 n=1 Tax=Sebastes fasciatus TaxID=394691 RepID=UPI003D9F815D